MSKIGFGDIGHTGPLTPRNCATFGRVECPLGPKPVIHWTFGGHSFSRVTRVMARREQGRVTNVERVQEGFEP
jgi:hypothetical protein